MPWWIYSNRKLLFAEDDGFVASGEWWIHLLVTTLEHSGPTFIKLGQYASSRTDVLPPSICKILSRLQSNVKPHSFADTKRAIKDELGVDMDQIFESFDAKPIGVGAIAQVHKARLRRNPLTGVSTECAVKVLHPGVSFIIDADLTIIHLAAYFIDFIIPGAKWLSLPDEVAMFSSMMRAQLDLATEATNLERFRYNFHKTPQIDFPSPIRPLVSRGVLVEQYIDALPVTTFLELGPSSFDKAIAQLGIQSFLKMLVVDNFVHADLHPGNVFISFERGGELIDPTFLDSLRVQDNKSWNHAIDSLKKHGYVPRLILLDAGLVSELTPSNLTNFVDLLTAVTVFDGEKVAELMVTRSRDPSTCKDLKGFQDRMRGLLNQVRGETLQLSRFTFSFILNNVFDMVRKYRVRLEGDFANVGISVMLVEGIGRRLDPKVDLLAEAGPVLRSTSSSAQDSIADHIKDKTIWLQIYSAGVLYVLYETAAGYALFERIQSEEIGQNLEDVQKATQDLAKFGRYIKMKSFAPFKSAAHALENLMDITEGTASEHLKSFLEVNLPKGKKNAVQLGVADKSLAGSIQNVLGVTCLSAETDDTVAELIRGLRLHSEKLLKQMKDGDMYRAQLGLGHSYSRAKVKFNVNRSDNMIIQSINLLDQLDKDVNLFSMRVREWYSWHFPELIKVVGENATYARCVKYIKNKGNLSESDIPGLEKILKEDASKAKAILQAAATSMGTDISEIDMQNIEAFADRVISLTDYRKRLHSYLVSKMHQVAPNLSALIGEMVGARLIAHAGSLTNLSKYPASTVQILGAEKALFRALKTRGNTPKYGLIYHSTFIGRAAAKNKGRISRILANKCSIASRIDCFLDKPTSRFGELLREQVEERLAFYEDNTTPRKNSEVMSQAVKEVNDAMDLDDEDSTPRKRKAPMDDDEEDDGEEKPKKTEKKKKKKKVEKEDEEEEEQEEEKPKKKSKKVDETNGKESKKEKKKKVEDEPAAEPPAKKKKKKEKA
ncbi:snoRNP complex protein nop56 [Phlyctochytrium planicorne]|nr:snoRNP complex protein nop56 [Phlyctochytrium planicorne]